MYSAAQPSHYIRGPDIRSKSKCTQRQYRQLLDDQASLIEFGFIVLA
jgi:hypothetical protein